MYNYIISFQHLSKSAEKKICVYIQKGLHLTRALQRVVQQAGFHSSTEISFVDLEFESAILK